MRFYDNSATASVTIVADDIIANEFWGSSVSQIAWPLERKVTMFLNEYRQEVWNPEDFENVIDAVLAGRPS